MSFKPFLQSVDIGSASIAGQMLFWGGSNYVRNTRMGLELPICSIRRVPCVNKM